MVFHAIRWQVLRDLVGAAERAVEQARQQVAREGWGARLLALQDPEGTWAGGFSSDGGLYSPKCTQLGISLPGINHAAITILAECSTQ